ncbi:MAG: hypothetical protein GX097_02295 [Methanomicrobiales archaeon]|nr:hypothetical protein [Methanomicrobiales archaeon]
MNNAEYFSAYILKLKSECPLLDETAGHTIASMIIGYRMGLFDRAVTQGEKALKLFKNLDGIPGVLSKAVMIVASDARKKLPGQVTIKSSFNWDGGDPTDDSSRIPLDDDDTKYAFCADSTKYLAVALPQEKVDIRDAYMLDTALMLLYGVAVCSSPMDEQAMEEHLRDYLIQRLGLYRDQ